MQFVKGKPPEIQNATRPGARAKRREVALGRPGFEPGRIARMAEFKAIPRPIPIQGPLNYIAPPSLRRHSFGEPIGMGSCALQRGLGLMYGRSFNVARASGRQFMPGLDVPVQGEGLV
jgi:hypothetical protein